MLKKLLLLSTLLFTTNIYAQGLENGEVSSRDLLTNDVKTSQNFYTKLFGWKAVQKENYVELYEDKEIIANIINIDKNRQSQWIPQFKHNNLKKAKEEILKNKGTILKEVTQNNTGDNYLLIKDTQNALSILTDASTGEHSPKIPSVNNWLWDELWSHNLKESQDFYVNVFEYKVEVLNSAYIIFKNNDDWTAGLINNPFEESQTQWVSTIRVNNTKAVSEKVLELGGTILVSVEQNKGFRDAALIKDPTGAIFIIENYEEKEQK